MQKEKQGLELTLQLPDKVEARIEHRNLILKGPKGEVKRDIFNPALGFRVETNCIKASARKSTKRDKKLLYAYEAHIQNMIKGVTENHKYILKICSSHFPMNVSVSNNQLTIKNFLGEKHPRVLLLKQGVNVKIEGNIINVESADKELAGTTASDIEKLTKRANFDSRIFQDGIFITNKDGKEVR